MRFFFMMAGLLAVSAGAAEARDLRLDCVARQVCVSNIEPGRASCQQTELRYRLEVGRKTGAKVVMTPEGDDAGMFYEFRRLPGRAGIRLQASGGALEAGQGAGALTVFETLDFVLTRHNALQLDPEDGALQAIAVSVHGSCAESE
ncbi:hypothetical protein JMM61_00085 [Rhodovulum sulfidophilum]|uniref:hypothetical protein n=1 Tax=Rhodovulum sulfidophilum TaxID=35806 RepID=UPI001927651F|nr:hypothetical protein [Rhodovulum sulfidophilum]MBL3583772.1 hypothetical protein [Rhodovulum sulfidophilum]MCE8440922.1 hypothetical protein [Rhodovulum sulfidophilum]